MTRIRRIAFVAAAAAMVGAAGVSGSAGSAGAAPAVTPTECTTRRVRVFGNTDVRSAPDSSSSAVAEVPANSFVVMTDDQPARPSSWIGVVVDGRTGFVTTKYAEGPWLNKLPCGEQSIAPVPLQLQQKILDEGL